MSIFVPLRGRRLSRTTRRSFTIPSRSFSFGRRLRRKISDPEGSIIQSSNEMGRIGEPGVPAIAPALVNAIFAATRKRLRSRPIIKQGITIAG